MPLSEEASAGLWAAVEWNPYGARELLAILREYPAWVKYKDEPYGPLSLLLFGVMPRRWVWDGISVCGREWRTSAVRRSRPGWPARPDREHVILDAALRAPKHRSRHSIGLANNSARTIISVAFAQPEGKSFIPMQFRRAG